MNKTLIPASIRCFIGNDELTQELNISEVTLELSFENGSGYDDKNKATMDGKESFMLKEGKSETKLGKASVTLIQTPDGKQDKSIQALENALESSYINDQPEKYTQNITFGFKTSGDKKFLHVTFGGYVKTLVCSAPEGPDSFSVFKADFQISNPASLTLKVS